MDAELIQKRFKTATHLLRSLAEDRQMVETIGRIADAMVNTYRNGGKVMFCGNGGSASDAQHLAAELAGKYFYDRPPLPALALHTNSSYLTATANDYGFEHVFARMVEAIGKQGDMLVGISTSGKSPNVILALQQARRQQITTVVFTGNHPPEIRDYADFIIAIPSGDVPRIQEMHILIGHIICELVEKSLFQ